MEALDKRKQDRLTKGIFLNVLVFVACAVYIDMSVLPQYTEINGLIDRINTVNADVVSLKKDGVDHASFTALLNKLGKKKEVPDIVFSDTEKLDNILKKPASVKKDYLGWLVDENAKVNILDKEIQQNDRILGNIVPVFMSSLALSMSEEVDNQITLASFISYVEKDILGKYSLTSYTPLGISNISFPDKKDTPVNIGSFKITLDFKGKNSDILALVDALQKSGKLTIRNGKLVPDSLVGSASSKEKGLSSLSNLLVSISEFSLASVPEADSADNQGIMGLEFYVEGMNYQKITILRTLLATKYEGLDKSIKSKAALCAKPGNALCNETATANAVATIKGLAKNLAALKPKFDAFKKGDITIDVNKEMDSLLAIKDSLQTIEMTYLKNNSILEKAKK